MLSYGGISLIPIEEEDLNILNKWKNDEDVFKFLGGGYQPISISQQRTWIQKMTENTSTNQRFIIVNEENKKVGFIGLYDISNIHRTCSLGIYIGEKQYRKQGIATRAYKALEKYSKDYLNIRKIKLEVVKDNENAVKMYEKLEFKICGKHEKDRYIEGIYRDVLLMEKFI